MAQQAFDVTNPIHRPYAQRGARLTSKEPSVTTIISSMVHKPGLSYAAARETALFAVLHPDRWTHLSDAGAVDVLRRHYVGIWDSRAAMGSLIHGVNEAYCAGEEVDLDRLIAKTMEEDPGARLWPEHYTGDPTEAALGYVLGLEKWWHDFQPTHVQSEVVVRWPGLFIGQTDLRCTCLDSDFLFDLKTTSKQDEGSGMYGREWALQLGGYGMAKESVGYELEPAKTKSGYRVVEASIGTWTPPERYGIIHLRGDEDYTAYEIDVTRDVRRTFLRMARAYRAYQAIPETPTRLEVGA